MITGFQLKAAKAVLGLTAKDIAGSIGVHPGTITRLCDTKNLEYLKCSVKNLVLIKKFFEKNNILFPNEKTISLYREIKNINSEKLTRFQLKAARIATGMTQEELGFHIKISSSMLSILENLENDQYIDPSKINTNILKKFFEHLGIFFPDDFTVTIEKDSQILAKKS